MEDAIVIILFLTAVVNLITAIIKLSGNKKED